MADVPQSDPYVVCIECGHRHPTRPPDDVCQACGKRFVVDVAAAGPAEIARALAGQPQTWAQRWRWLVPFTLAVGLLTAVYLGMVMDRPLTTRGPRSGPKLEAANRLSADATAALLTAIAGHRPELETCLAATSEPLPATVQVDLRWRIELDGHASNVSVAYASWSQADFLACVVAAADRWQLGPRPEPVTVDYPFVLAASP